MPWKDGYTISDERSIADHEIRWPDQAVCSFTVTVALDPLCGKDGLQPKDFSGAEAFYGLNRGLDRLRAVLDKHRIRATFATSAATATIYPAILKSLAADGYEIAAHGFRREDVSDLDVETERKRLQRTTECIASIVGQRPMGWYSLPRQGDRYSVGAISSHTMSLLIEAKYTYMGNGLADDVPHYWTVDPAGPTTILVMPYYYHFDDQFFLLFPAKGSGLEHADNLARNWRAEMDAQYKRGRSFAMVLHPNAIGWGHRIKYLDDFLLHVRKLPKVWNATAFDCARHWLARHPPEKILHLEPSVWQDYPDSLS